jgi:hypothetical protein
VQSVLQTANTLNNALLTITDPQVSEAFYLALVKGLVSSDRLVYGAVIVLDPGHGSSTPSAVRSSTPYVFRNSSTGQLQVSIILHDRLLARCQEGAVPLFCVFRAHKSTDAVVSYWNASCLALDACWL